MIYAAMLWYLVSLVLFASSMSNPARPGIEYLAPMLVASTVLFGVLVYRRLYRKRR